MNMTALTHPAPSRSYRSFRDEGVTRRAERLRRKEANRRKRNAVLAALGLAGTVFSATMAAPLLSSQAATPPAEQAACVEAGLRLAPWFKAEAEREAQVGLGERDNFNLLLTWFRKAQSQCASGQTARAVENFKAVERMIAERVEQHQPEDEDE